MAGTINPDTSKMPLTFDDIECGCLASLNGRQAIVIAKGEHVSHKRDGRHVQIQFIDEENEKEFQAKPKLRENIVNRYLKEKRRLWIDFDHRLNPYEED